MIWNVAKCLKKLMKTLSDQIYNLSLCCADLNQHQFSKKNKTRVIDADKTVKLILTAEKRLLRLVIKLKQDYLYISLIGSVLGPVGHTWNICL